MIEPLYGGKSAIEVLATLLGEEPSEGSDLVRKHFPMVLAERRARSEPQASPEDPQAIADRTERDTETHWRKTLHDAEGLNVMVYNRCVGTRYCANNCPYKVRRFNYFNYHKKLTEPASEVTKMVYNPEVTVRSRGVMEKCTYCVQRIKAAAIEARNGNRRVEDGDVKTACQQVCPTGAIAFGDLADPKSQVARAAAGDRSYAMLGELNVKPRTVYLARIRNPNPRLEAADHHGVTEEHGAGS